jgi:hypothetical protein
MNSHDINELIELKNNILLRKKDVKNDPLLIKELNREYSRIQIKIKYYSDDDYRKAKCNAVKLFIKLILKHIISIKKNTKK